MSRLAGALGDGDLLLGYKYLGEAGRLVVAVLGIGRLGWLMALRLAQSGIGAERGLILADADIVEESGLDVMMLPPQAVGMPKAVAAAGMLMGLLPEANVVPLVGTVSDQAVADALAAADVVISAVDEDFPRIGAAVLACRYHRVHIDVSGGTAYLPGGKTTAGGEVRMAVPGSPGCVGCFGRYDWDEVDQLLSLSAGQERTRREKTQWREQRPGSSGDVLFAVAGEAQLLLWRLIKGEARSSTWLHYERQISGVPLWQEWTPSSRRTRRCRLCSSQPGRGDPGPSGRLSHAKQS